MAPTTVEPLEVATHKVCKSIIHVVVMSYIVGSVCIYRKQNCAISRRNYGRPCES